MTPVFLDFETYWDSDYTLSKMSQIEYVMDDRFEAISCGIKVGGGETVVYVGDEIGPALAAIDWEDSIAVAHNMAFDGLILAWRYGYTPALWACTLCMARPLHGKDVGGSLKYLSEYYGYQPKGVLQTKGRRLADLLPAEIAALRTYNVTDVDICARLFKVFLPVTSLGELRLIDRTLRMALEPRLEADTVLLEHGLKAERTRKEKALQRLSTRLHMHPNELRQELASAQKFAALLESWGVEVPTKPSPATGKPIPALAKTDYGMQDLLEHEDELVRTASELRLDVKSTILETRIESMLRVAAACDGKMPITLNYYGATNTGRWCLTPDHEVFTKQGWVRLDTWAGQEVMQWDPADASLTWCSSPAVTSFDVDEGLIAFSGRHHKAIYTAEHRIPCRAHHSDAVVDVTASQLASIQQRKMFMSGFAKEGVEVQDVVLKLTVAMHADGYNVHDSKNNMVRFRFVKQRKVERIQALLTEAGIPFSVTSYPSEPHVTVVLVRGKDAPQWLREAKKLPEYFYQLSGAQAEVVLRELPYWDGCTSGPNSTSCTTKDKDAALKYATLAHLCGWRAKITHVDRAASGWSDTYKVSVCPTNIYSARGDHAKRLSYKGKVYCPTVDTGYFLCRREDSIFVTGNSGGGGLNQQNYPRVNPNQFKLTDVLRLSLKAPEGHQIVVADLAGIELRVNMFLWQVPYAMELFRADPDKADLYKAFAATLYRVPVADVDKTMRQMGKLCVAEGTLVLTKRGEVPIEQVTSSDAVWDGVEWVDTLGPVYNGEQEVITHDNITATPDHVVWVEDGRALSLEEAATQSLRLARTGTGGAPVGFVGADRHSVYPARRLPLRESTLHRLRDGAHDELRQPESREVYALSVLCGKMRGAGVVDSAHGSSEATLHQPEGQSVLSLRGEGDTVLFPERSRSSGVGDGELGAASGPGDRSRGQQRELRARKHSLRFSEGEHQQPEQLDNAAVPQVSDDVPGGTVRGHYAAQHAKPRHDLRGDRVPLGGTVVQTKRRVWDLLDCGPRHRFTANGRLISNCHLGLGYGASANTFRRVAKTMGGVEVPQTEAENIVNVWREAHQEVVQGWWKCTGALHAMYSGREMAIDPWGLCRTGKDHIILPRGILRYTDLRQENDSTGKPNWVYGKGRYKTKIYSSKLDENLVQALSRYVLSDIMLAYADTELGQRYPIVHCVHDELVVVAADNDAQAVLDLLLTLMKTPPAWWPELVTSAEGSFAQRYGEAK